VASRNPDRPNLLFVLTDDQGPWAMGCAGNSEIRTPTLDRLAAEGLRFENCFCTSPVCSPARASILTGRIPSQHGIHDFLHKDPGNDEHRYLEGQPTYVEVLNEGGYETGLSGKWHLGYGLEPQKGFNAWDVMPYGGCDYFRPPIVEKGEVVRYEETYASDLFTDNALKFLDGQLGSPDPFCHHLHFTAPHRPWEREFHPGDLWDDYNNNCPFDSVPVEPLPQGYFVHRTVDAEKRRGSLAGYFAAVTAMDLNVGRVIDWLEENDLRRNTLVVFMSDNGMNMGHHGFYGKGNGTRPQNMFENSVKVPFIVSRPGFVPENSVNANLVSQYDWLPTLLEYTGFADHIPQGLPGRSFAPLLEGREMEERESVYVCDEYGPVRMIRTKEWKLVWRHPGGAHELYHLADDPSETTNLIERRELRGRIDSMRRDMKEWFSRYVDPNLDGTKHPITGCGQRGPVGSDGAFEIQHPMQWDADRL